MRLEATKKQLNSCFPNNLWQTLSNYSTLYQRSAVINSSIQGKKQLLSYLSQTLPTKNLLRNKITRLRANKAKEKTAVAIRRNRLQKLV